MGRVLVKGRGNAYTLGMLGMVLILSAVVGVPLEALMTGEAPKAIPTFRINFPNDDKDYYGALRVDGEWITDRSGPGPEAVQVEIVFDTPWQRRNPYRVLRSKVQFRYESFAKRQKRIEDGWDNAGYTFVSTPSGWQPVLKTDLEFAQRARAMAAQREPSAAAPEPEETPAPAGEAAAEFPPGFMVQWGAHIAVALVGMALLALVVKTLLLGNES